MTILIILSLVAVILMFSGKGQAIVAPPRGMTPLVNKAKKLANAIAYAEGYWDKNYTVLTANVPARANNPGDLRVGDIGNGVLGPSQVTVYASAVDGWRMLNGMVLNWFTGHSSIYFPTDTIRDVARKYVNGPAAPADTNSENWARNVGEFLGISVDQTLAGFSIG